MSAASMSEPLAAREAPASYVLEMQRVRQGYKQTDPSTGSGQGMGVIPEDWGALPLSVITSEIGDGLHGTPTYSSNGTYFFINPDNPLGRHSGAGRNPAMKNAPQSGQNLDVVPHSWEII